jgi:photosynthetic reaction center cytochrome c subunit
VSIKLRLAVCCLFLFLFCWAGIHQRFTAKGQEQRTAPAAPAAKPTPNEGFGNVQVLKGVRDLLPTMHFIRASLGVRCDYCHITETGKYYLDDKPAKRRAREMIIMTRQLNEANFGGRQVITCNTCHRGSTKPLDIPQIATNFVNTTRVEPFEPPPPALPSAQEILSKYEAATSASTFGPARLRLEDLRGKLMSGNTGSGYIIPRGERSITEALVDGERGASTLPLFVGSQPVRIGSTGKRLWYISADRPRWAPPGSGISQFQRKINPLLVLRVRAADFATIDVAGVEKVEGRDAYIVTAVGADGSAETLWFSKRGGLLLRRTYYRPTLLGPEPEQYDLSGYKRFGATRLPTVINVSYLDDQHLGVLRRLIDVKLGVTVTDKDFEPPVR